MKASTHTEIYRPFTGTLRTRGPRFWPLFVTGVRVAARRKLPLLLLYAPAAICTVIFSFLVYAAYLAESGMEHAGVGIRDRMAAAVAQNAVQQLQVRKLVLLFHQIMVWFTMLTTAWFGSGLFAEDRRVGAHQLYFSRPLTRLDYALGKLAVVAFFSACALLLPGLWLCTMASFTSPEWSFLREQPEVIAQTVAYEILWVLVTSLAVLAMSSLASKKVFALIGMFALFVLTFAMASLLGHEVDARFFAISPILDVWAVGDWLFDVGSEVPQPPLGLAVRALAGCVTLFVLVIAWRLRRLEVVA